MATAPGQLDQTRRRAREVREDLRERFEGLEPVVRERWSDLEPVVRERWNELEPLLRARWEELEPAVRERWSEVEPVVRERWNELEPVVRERLDHLEPAVRQARIGGWRVLRALFGALAVLPTLLIRLLKTLAGAADEAAERGQQVGGQALKRGQEVGEEALKRRRRRRGVHLRRRTLVAYVAAAVGVGFAVGWVLGRQRPEEDVAPEEAPFEASGPAGNGEPRRDASLTE